MMIRTQIQLPEDSFASLQREAQRQGRSMADCIREAIGLFLRRAAASPDDLLEVAGRFQPLPPTDLKPHDQWWADAAVGEQGSRRAP
jgi:hypothetical protein